MLLIYEAIKLLTAEQEVVLGCTLMLSAAKLRGILFLLVYFITSQQEGSCYRNYDKHCHSYTSSSIFSMWLK